MIAAETAPLGLRRPAEATLARALSSLGSGLCHDAGMRVEVAGEDEPWSFDPFRRVLRVGGRSLRERGADWCAGRVANEVGHVWLTRHDLFLVGFPSDRVGRVLLDCLEDGRVDGWMRARYPGVAPWLGAVHADLAVPADLPLVIQFGLGCAVEAAGGRVAADPRVHGALERTRSARRRYAACVPATSVGTVTLPHVARQYRARVWPELAFPGRMPAPYEAEVQLRALDALEEWREHIASEAAALYRADVEAIAAWLAANPDAAEQARQCRDRCAASALLAGCRGGGAGAPSAETRRAAMGLLDALVTRARGPGDGDGDGAGDPLGGADRLCAGGRPMEGGGRMVWRPLSPGMDLRSLASREPMAYDVALDQVAPQIDRLVSHLDRLLRLRQRLGGKAGYPSGRRADLRAVMAFEADPRRYDRLWIRDTVPDRRRSTFSLLVDLSGSMYGSRIDAALQGTIVLAETLARLKVPFAIHGFQDELIPISAPREPFGPAVRERIAAMVQEVSASRPGGNNRPSYNDDGPCLLECAERLLQEPAEDKFLIVVSDGIPEGCRSNSEDLHAAVRSLGKEPLQLLGLGLGEGTEHVKRFYPNHLASVPLEGFADAVAGAIRVALHADD